MANYKGISLSSASCHSVLKIYCVLTLSLPKLAAMEVLELIGFCEDVVSDEIGRADLLGAEKERSWIAVARKVLA